METKISVIMPVFNSGIYLEKAVNSLVSQSLKELEIILVDDGSTDGSSEKCDSFARDDARIVVIHKTNGGICSARNSALEIVKGKYIAFCDHDDFFEQDALSVSYEFAEKNNLDILKFGHSIIRNVQGKEVSRKQTSFESRTIQSSMKDSFLELVQKKVLNDVWDGLFLTSFVKKTGCLFDTFYKSGGEDFDFNRRLATFNPKIGTLKNVFYNHYIRLGVSTSSGYKALSIKRAVEWPITFASYLNKLEIRNASFNINYIKVAMQEAVGALANSLSKEGCPLTYKEKTFQFKELKSNFIQSNDIFNNSFFIARKLGLKYGFLFILVKLNLFKPALMLYRWKKI